MTSLFRHAYNSIFRPDDSQMVQTSSLPSDDSAFKQDYCSSRLIYDNRSDQTLKLMQNVMKRWDDYDHGQSDRRGNMSDSDHVASSREPRHYQTRVNHNNNNHDGDQLNDDSTQDVELLLSHVEENNKFILKMIDLLNKSNISNDLKELELLKDLQVRYNDLLIKYNRMDSSYKNDREFAKKTFRDYELLVKEHQRLKLDFEDYVPKKLLTQLKDRVSDLESENRSLSRDIEAQKTKLTGSTSDLELENKRLRLQLEREREEIDTLKKQLSETRTQLKSNKIASSFSQLRKESQDPVAYEIPPILRNSSLSSSQARDPLDNISPLKVKQVRSSRLSSSNYNSHALGSIKIPPKTDEDTIARFKKQYEDLKLRTRVPIKH